MARVLRIVLFLVLLTLVGTVGLMLIEGWDAFDALYMTVITLTTVGYEEVQKLSPAGRAFIMAYLVVGLGVFLYSAAQLGELIVRAQLRDWLEKRKAASELKALSDHFIVCGFGRMGKRVCQQLAERGMPFLVIERDEARLDECRLEDWPWLQGDATEDRTLEEAGIERARGLATVLGSDADNLFVVMSARLMRRDIQILARAADEKGATKMQKAGANRVVSLYTTGAAKMTQLLVNPKVEDFIEIVTGKGREMDLAEIQVTTHAPFAGKILKDTDFRAKGIIIVCIRRASGEVLLPPPSSAVIEEGDSLMALGEDQAIRQLVESA